MKNKMFIIALITVLVVGGGVFAFISMDKDDSKIQSSQSSTDESKNTETSSTDNPLGIDIEAQKGPYRMTLDTLSEAGEASTMTFDVDKDGDIKSTIVNGDDEVTMIYVGNILYTQNPEDGSWIKLSSGSTDALEGAFTQEDIEEMKNSNFVKTGTATCTAGTCDIYEGTDPNSGEKLIAKIDRKNNRISDMETNIDGSKSVFSFNYSATIGDIIAPEGAVELNIPGADSQTE